MKAYYGKPQFAEGWYEDLDNCIYVYETLSNMFSVAQEEKLGQYQ